MTPGSQGALFLGPPEGHPVCTLCTDKYVCMYARGAREGGRDGRKGGGGGTDSDRGQNPIFIAIVVAVAVVVFVVVRRLMCVEYTYQSVAPVGAAIQGPCPPGWF